MSNPITCIIVDDEPPAIRLLQKYIEQLQGLECVATCTRAVEALALIEEHKPDVVFLDIQMPDLTGLQLSAIIKDNVKIIFTTAYAQFAVEGFEVNAVDYLLKPIPFNRFITAVEKVRKQNTETAAVKFSVENTAEYFFVKTGKTLKKLLLADIWYFEGEKEYVRIVTGEGEILVYRRLKEIEEQLSQPFLRVHKSYIVNMKRIKQVQDNHVYIENKQIPVSDKFRAAFTEFIRQKLF